jgi:hypothetical protein
MNILYAEDYDIIPDYRVNLMGFLNYLLDHGYGRPLFSKPTGCFSVDLPINLITKELKLDVKRGTFSSKKVSYPPGVIFNESPRGYRIKETGERFQIRSLIFSSIYLSTRQSKVLVDLTVPDFENLSNKEELIVFSHPFFSQLVLKNGSMPFTPPRYFLKKTI